MKQFLYKTICIALIAAHLVTVYLRDLSFADSSESSAIEGSQSTESVQESNQTAPLSEQPQSEAGNITNNNPQPTRFNSPDEGSSGQAPNYFGFNLGALRSFQSDPFTGRATFAIPINVPAGRKGIQPNITLVYSSGAGNGIVGLGWSLELGSIERSTKKGAPKYDSTDTFVVNYGSSGSELVSIGNNEYGAKIESAFMKFIFDGAYWIAIDKSGTKYCFGKNSINQVFDGSRIFKWALEKIIDVHGNYLTIDYLKSDNQLYPNIIQYTANENNLLYPSYYNKIFFSWDKRNDVILSYRPGFRTAITKKLSNVAVFNQDTLAKYYFRYDFTESEQSLLASVIQASSDEKASLPPITFEYQQSSPGWTLTENKFPDDLIAHSGTLVLDVNNDGFPDIVDLVKVTGGSEDLSYRNNFYLGTKDGSWQKTTDWKVPALLKGITPYPDYVFISSMNLADLNGDGWIDILYHYHNNGNTEPPYAFLNNKINGWDYDEEWSKKFPCDAYFYGFQSGNLGYAGYALSDINGDSLVDIIRASTDGHEFYLNTGSGWIRDTTYDTPTAANFTNGSTQLGDINADGLLDLIIATKQQKDAFLNTGNGWQRESKLAPSDWFIDFSTGSTQLTDINSDGLVDIVLTQGSNIYDINNLRKTYLNTHRDSSPWVEESDYALPEGDLSEGAKLIDAQGRYLQDILINQRIIVNHYWKTRHTAYRNNNKILPDYLTKISNGIGGEVRITYKSSTQFDSTGGDGICDLPFPVYVVDTVTTHDTVNPNNPDITTRYEYKNGLFDLSEREFRGFGIVKTIDSQGNYTENYFKQDSIFKGRLYKQEIKDKDGKLYSRTENTWKNTQPYSRVNFVYLERIDNYLYEGEAEFKRHTGSSFEYDSYGNPTKVISDGATDQTGDEKTQVTEYTYNTKDWILSTPKHTYLLDDNQNKVSEKWFYYDDAASIDTEPVKGLLTQEEVLIFNPVTQTSDTATTKYAYNVYGNLIKVTDPEGKTTTTEYDPCLQTYPIKVTNALGHRVKTAYYGITNVRDGISDIDFFEGFGLLGQVKYTKDPNNQKTYNVYDTLGRLIKVIGSLDTEEFPAVIYEYDLTSKPIKITKKVKASYGEQPAYYASYDFYDGLGRLIETKSPAEPDPQTQQARQIISDITKLDSRGQLKESYLPYFVVASEDYVSPAYNTAYTGFTYDSMGRLIQTTNPDSSYSNLIYSDWTKAVIDENGHKQVSYSDAYGRLIKIEEYIGADGRSAQYPQQAHSLYSTTTYEYDALDNLTKVTDDQNNTTQIWYDSLERKIQMSDPDMGIWIYEYDKADNLIKQTDAKGHVLEFTYDSINRLTKKIGGISSNPNTSNPKENTLDSSTVLLLDFDQIQDLSLSQRMPYLHGNAIIDSTQGRSNNTSLYVDGKTGYLTLDDSDDWSFGVQDFTIDFWIKFDDVEKYQMLLSQELDYGSMWFIAKNSSLAGNRLEFMFAYAQRTVEAGYSMLKSWPVSVGRWYHIAITRIGQTAKLFIDGVSQTLYSKAEFSDKDVGNIPAPLFIGSYDGTDDFLSGWIDNLRVTKGKALWTSDFTPPQEEIALPREGVITLATYIYDDVTKPNCIGRLFKVTDQSGSTEFFYDSLGRETKSTKTVTGSGTYAVERGYDALDRPITLKYPDGEIVTYTYTPQGIETVISQRSSGNGTYISDINYSQTGQITRIQYGNGTETTYTYNPNTLRLTDLVTESIQGRIQNLSYQFDSGGNITNLTDYINTATQSFDYDALNRLIYAAGSYGTFNYDYDSIGNMLNKEGITLTYGKDNRLPHAVTQYGDTLIDYDANGNMVKKDHLELSYDVENRLTKIEDKSLSSVSGTKTITLTLNLGWNFISLPFMPKDPKISTVLSPITGKYDQVSRYNPGIKEFEHYVADPEFDQFDSFEYGRGYQIYITSPTNLTLEITGSLPEGMQLVQLKTGANLIFSPKDIETEVETALNPLKIGIDYSKVLYYDKSQSKFLEYSPDKKEFDTLKPGVSYYLYCLEDKSWQIEFPIVTTSFIYDGDGGRVKKTTGLASTIYIGSLFDIQKQADGSQKTEKHIFAGANRIATITLRASATEGGASREDTTYYHSDHLGSSNVITDKDGNQISLTEFTPYGSISKQTGTYDSKYKFTGKELDATTGLYYYGARYYSPDIARFITPDTIVQELYDPQSLNRYVYARNNPVKYVDPTGHTFASATASFFIGIGSFIGGMFSAVGGFISGFARGAFGSGNSSSSGNNSSGSPKADSSSSSSTTSQRFISSAYNFGVSTGSTVGGAFKAATLNIGGGIKDWLSESRAGYFDLQGNPVNSADIQPDSKVFTNGVRTSFENALAQAREKKTGYLFYNPSSSFMADYIESFLQKITFTSSIDRQMAAGLAKITGKVDVIGFSQGALTLSNALVNLGLRGIGAVNTASYLNYPISQLRGAISSWVSGAHPEYGSNTFDPINVIGPNLNPIEFVGGIIGGMLFQSRNHSLDK